MQFKSSDLFNNKINNFSPPPSKRKNKKRKDTFIYNHIDISK